MMISTTSLRNKPIPCKCYKYFNMSLAKRANHITMTDARINNLTSLLDKA